MAGAPEEAGEAGQQAQGEAGQQADTARSGTASSYPDSSYLRGSGARRREDGPLRQEDGAMLEWDRYRRLPLLPLILPLSPLSTLASFSRADPSRVCTLLA